MNKQEIEIRITKFLGELSSVEDVSDIQNQEGLLSNQVIDSLGIIELVAHIESQYNITMGQDDLTVENFDSVDAISSYIFNNA